MGQKAKISKLDVQKERLKQVFIKLLETNVEIMRFQAALTDKKEEKKGLLEIAKKSQKAIEIIKGIEHLEILISLYNMYVNKKETYFISIYATITSKHLKRWDKTKKGFKEFQRLEKEAIEDYNKKQEESRKKAEEIKKAQEEGKKVQMIYKDGKIVPIIVEEKPN